MTARQGSTTSTSAPSRGASGSPPGATLRPEAAPSVEETAPPAGEGRRRVCIEAVEPEVDGGRFPVKRTVGEHVVVEADAFTDGHDRVACVLRWRPADEDRWSETRMGALGNDRWRGRFQVDRLGEYRYTVQAWVDRFGTWRADLRKRVEAGQDVDVDLRIGAELVEEVRSRAPEGDRQRLRRWTETLRGSGGEPAEKRALRALDDELATLMGAHDPRRHATEYPRELAVVVDRERARFSAWYEMFPRSCAPEGRAHGTFRDCEARLPYIVDMGFDVLYLPPIHPIGVTKRKGRDNRPEAEPVDVGSPWAIGSEEGGHTAVHPDLGTLEDFDRFRREAEKHGLEVALDIAFQCSPDHPWVEEHPEWFRWRPDGTVQYAENPPKKYEDIYPLNFDSEDWRGLWEALRDVFTFWIGHGVKIFRVDNPHTKPFPFWEWCIGEIRAEHPEVIVLSEAFTRPKVMYRLAKLGFTQSYTYFAWRNTAWELREYLTELTKTEASEYFRPNLWPNTPDILTEYVQTGGRAGTLARLVLAATLGASYGIYGPVFELFETTPREPGSEEYLSSEKYQVRHWDLDSPHSASEFIGRVNRIRRENPALRSNENLRFHPTDNEQLLVYSKRTPERDNIVLVCVNLDPHHTQSGWVEVDRTELGVEENETYQVHDLLGDARFLWQGSRNYVELNPAVSPAHIFRVGRRTRSERDFDYYL